MGVLAVYGVPDASTLLYYGLHNLQHRGQEGGGIATFDEQGESYRYRGLGLLNEVFNNGQVAKLKGNLGIGCVKYATPPAADWTMWGRSSSATTPAISPWRATGTS